MNKYIKLAEKIKSMTGKEIMLAMVDSLRNPVTKIDMTSFGHKENGICFGCAATNTICKIGGLNPEEEIFELLSFKGFTIGRYSRKYACKIQEDKGEDLEAKRFINAFEAAVDFLRTGNIEDYNGFANDYGFSKIEPKDMYLPHLNNDFHLKELELFENYANSL